MASNVQFVLRKEQVDFLRKNYSAVPIVQKVLAAEQDLHFEITPEVDSDFFLWLDEESVETMKNYEPTDDTYMIEGIIDYVHSQER
jgi:hypothetical protein